MNYTYKAVAKLPFSWCRYCTRADMAANLYFENGEVHTDGEVIEGCMTACANAPICEAMIKAMQYETNMIPSGKTTIFGSKQLNLRLFAAIQEQEPGTVLDDEKWLAEIERQFREGLDRAIRDIRTKGWPG